MNAPPKMTEIEYEDGKCIYLTEAQMIIIGEKVGDVFASHIEGVVKRALLKAMGRRLIGSLFWVCFWCLCGWMIGRHPEVIAKIQEWGE